MCCCVSLPHAFSSGFLRQHSPTIPAPNPPANTDKRAADCAASFVHIPYLQACPAHCWRVELFSNKRSCGHVTCNFPHTLQMLKYRCITNILQSKIRRRIGFLCPPLSRVQTRMQHRQRSSFAVKGSKPTQSKPFNIKEDDDSPNTWQVSLATGTFDHVCGQEFSLEQSAICSIACRHKIQCLVTLCGLCCLAD